MTNEPADLTSLHVRRAARGDAESAGWLIEHLSPALHLQAHYRMRGPLRTWCDPTDLVQEVWAIALPRLPELVARDGRWTPVLVRFLSTTLLHLVNRMMASYLRGDRPHREASHADGGVGWALSAVRDSGESVPAAAARGELRDAVRAAIDALDEGDRAVLVLRGIEQLRNNKVAEILGVVPSAVTMRYQVALHRLRAALPGSVFAELAEDPDRLD